MWRWMNDCNDGWMDGWMDPPPPCLQGEHGVSNGFSSPHQNWGVFSPSYSPPARNRPRPVERYFHFGVILASKTHPRGTNFLTSSWYPLFFDFGAILVPTCRPKWSQNPPKIDPRAVQYPSQHPSYHRSLFLLIFDGFFIDFRSQNQWKFNKKSINKSSQQHNHQMMPISQK